MRRREPPPPIPTLGDLRRETCWLWVYCENRLANGLMCLHQAPVALTAPIIVWGPGATSDRLRTRMRCTACGARHSSVRRPSHVDQVVGVAPFPVSYSLSG